MIASWLLFLLWVFGVLLFGLLCLDACVVDLGLGLVVTSGDCFMIGGLDVVFGCVLLHNFWLVWFTLFCVYSCWCLVVDCCFTWFADLLSTGLIWCCFRLFVFVFYWDEVLLFQLSDFLFACVLFLFWCFLIVLWHVGLLYLYFMFILLIVIVGYFDCFVYWLGLLWLLLFCFVCVWMVAMICYWVVLGYYYNSVARCICSLVCVYLFLI